MVERQQVLPKLVSIIVSRFLERIVMFKEQKQVNLNLDKRKSPSSEKILAIVLVPASKSVRIVLEKSPREYLECRTFLRN
mmetsp:Transcript_878/g.1300  ORF Transcript_878/g.1300 Transcript_878/m.1300 type:complete len:80 (-) Transcript_878:94-333(-)